MKVFVWREIEDASDHYHHEGGLVVFARTLERAVELANANGAHPKKNEVPSEIRECTGGDEAVYVMPNAGCCRWPSSK